MSARVRLKGSHPGAPKRWTNRPGRGDPRRWPRGTYSPNAGAGWNADNEADRRKHASRRLERVSGGAVASSRLAAKSQTSEDDRKKTHEGKLPRNQPRCQRYSAHESLRWAGRPTLDNGTNYLPPRRRSANQLTDSIAALIQCSAEARQTQSTQTVKQRGTRRHNLATGQTAEAWLPRTRHLLLADTQIATGAPRPVAAPAP